MLNLPLVNIDASVLGLNLPLVKVDAKPLVGQSDAGFLGLNFLGFNTRWSKLMLACLA